MKQLIKFCIVGCLNFGISYSVFFLSYRYFPFSKLPGTFPDVIVNTFRVSGIFSIDAAIANVIGYAAGMANSFLWNKLWTFRALQETHRQAGRFILTNIGCLLLSTAAVFICVDIKHWPYNQVWISTMVLVTVINFIASKYWVFDMDQRRISRG